MITYVHECVNTSWRNYKNRLHLKYVKDKDPVAVKSSPAPVGVPIKDWILFVDQRNTNEFKELSARNASNRAKQVGPSTLRQRSMAVICHRMSFNSITNVFWHVCNVEKVIERNLTSDVEVGRADVYIRAHTTNDDKLQFSEAFEKTKSIQSSNPASQMTNVDDALTQSIGSDSRGHMRGIGGNVGKIALRKTIPIIDKLNMVTQDRDNLKEEVSEMKKSLVDLHMKVNYIVEKQGEQGVVDPPTIPPFKSSRALLPDLIHIGKRCDLCNWKKWVVARGEVHEVDLTAHVHGADLGEGNFRVVLIEIKASHTELWKEDGYHHTLGEVGIGGFVIWPKLFLTIYP
ncbi:uncharacterized protein LOC131230553 [Magnolia sinica]|uniref:uncharacterized protein LOC131230553 n=1 Tax=Magnolia sinica TaxID=86752 RepID=UPI00265AF41F|nr:uncharacterized protein LOC131230553 [Magnolia sinica]